MSEEERLKLGPTFAAMGLTGTVATGLLMGFLKGFPQWDKLMMIVLLALLVGALAYAVGQVLSQPRPSSRKHRSGKTHRHPPVKQIDPFPASVEVEADPVPPENALDEG